MASRIADILVRANLLDDLQLRSSLAHQQQWGGRLPAVVVEKHFAVEEKVTQAIADALKLPKVDLETLEHDAAALAKVDIDFARANAVFPCALKDGGKTLWLAMADPTDVPVVDQVVFKTRVRVKLVVASERQIQEAIKHYYLGQSSSAPPAQSYGAFASLDVSEGAEDEGKIVDMSGHTLVKNIKDIKPPESRSEKPAPPAISDLLDDMMGAGARASTPQWTAEEVERLRSIQDQQEKGARILRAVLDLCVEKGRFTPDEYRQRVKKGG
jgi:hypothetical protein